MAEISAFRIEMRFKEQAAGFGFVGTMDSARRAYGVGVAGELPSSFAAAVVANCQVAREQEHFFPVFVDEGRSSVDSGRETKEAGAGTAFGFFVERARDNLFLNAQRITGQRVPTLTHVESVEFFMSLIKSHFPLPSSCRVGRARDSCA